MIPRSSGSIIKKGRKGKEKAVEGEGKRGVINDRVINWRGKKKREREISKLRVNRAK